MARIHCAISGIVFHTDNVPLVLPATAGYFHPVFAASNRHLYELYSKHIQGHLTSTDSYLLFLAFLHSTDKIRWEHPATCLPKEKGTIQLVENNIQQLIYVIEASNIISHPSFQQPAFSVTKGNSKLLQVPNWIAAWEDNIIAFKEGYKSQRIQEDLQKLENKLSYYIKSGLSPKDYSFAVASWAAKAADFPTTKREEWCKIIRTCYNSNKMFSTPTAELKAIKEYCEENIEAGSIHFHSLMSILREGVKRHKEFLGLGSPEALGYTLLPVDSTQGDIELAAILAKAPKAPPKREDYDTSLNFLRAQLRYRVVTNTRKQQEKKPDETNSSNLNVKGKDTSL